MRADKRAVFDEVAKIAVTGAFLSLAVGLGRSGFQDPPYAICMLMLGAFLIFIPQFVSQLLQASDGRTRPVRLLGAHSPSTVAGVSLMALGFWLGASFWWVAAWALIFPAAFLSELTAKMIDFGPTLKWILRTTSPHDPLATAASVPPWAYHSVTEGLVLTVASVPWFVAGWWIAGLPRPEPPDDWAAILSEMLPPALIGALAAMIWAIAFSVVLGRLEVARRFEKHLWEKYVREGGDIAIARQIARDAMERIARGETDGAA